MGMEYSRQEFMAIATGREIRDGELIMLGVGLSMLAGYFAQKNHAPNLKPFTEGGIYGASPVGGLPWGIECNRISANATAFTSALDALGFMVASGRTDNAVIGAAQVDKYGNVNTTGIWDEPPWKTKRYQSPRVRLNGSGGANDIAVGCKRYLIMASHEKRRFVEKVDYISSPGYGDGGDARLRYGFIGGGPSAIISTLGILRPDPESKEFMLDAYFPFTDLDEVKANTGWELRVSSKVSVVPEPSAAELDNLRAVDVTGSLRKKG
jgi:glutaconate CoA-transferase subunit B